MDSFVGELAVASSAIPPGDILAAMEKQMRAERETQFGQLVQGTTNLVLPANVGDIGAMIALAMNVFNQQSAKGVPKP